MTTHELIAAQLRAWAQTIWDNATNNPTPTPDDGSLYVDPPDTPDPTPSEARDMERAEDDRLEQIWGPR